MNVPLHDGLTDCHLSECHDADIGNNRRDPEYEIMNPECDGLTKVLRIWTDILGPDISPEENFFEAGG